MTKKITIYPLALALVGACQIAFGHTTIRDEATEGGRTWTAATIPHGCGSDFKPDQLPVVAQSIVFPNGADAIAANAETNEPVDLSSVMEGANDHNGGLTVLSVRVIQDHEVFEDIEPILDENDNVHGMRYTNGSLAPRFTGVIPFNVTTGSFVPESCAKKIEARIAIANYCLDKSSVDANRRADVWVGKLTALFNDPDVVSVDFWPKLTINRDLEENPLNASCGEGFDVYLEPSPEDIDANLPIPGFWPANAQ